jgi:hypothetical protein
MPTGHCSSRRFADVVRLRNVVEFRFDVPGA